MLFDPDTFVLAAIVRQHALTRAESPALSFESTTLSFADLDGLSSRVANALMASGVASGDRVAVLSKNSPEFFEVMFGCSKIGAILVGLNWRLAPPEITAIVADAAPKMIVVGQSELDLLSQVQLPAGTLVLPIGPEFDDWRATGAATDPVRHGTADDVALLLYTSGTTGTPKGVMLTNRGLSYTARLASQSWGMSEASVSIVAMPLFHIGGIGYGLSVISQGGHTVLMREIVPAMVVDAIAAHRVTHAFFVPAVIQMLLSVSGVDAADLTSLQLLLYGASPIGDTLLKAAMSVIGCRFEQAYGMTETSGTIVLLPPEDHDPDGERAHLLRSCGKAVPFVELRVVDPTTLADAETDAVGEIWVRSPVVTKGYWNQPDATAESIMIGGWLRTGDAAYIDTDGYLYLFDRFKDMIVSGAENVYPAEVENALGDHRSVAEVAVIGVPDARWGETVKAIVVLRPGAVVDAGALIEFSRTKLAKFKCPTSVDFVDTLPRNASGKVLKKDLRAPYWATSDRSIG